MLNTHKQIVFNMTRSWVVLSSTLKGPGLISDQALKLSGERWMLAPASQAGLVCVGVCVWGGGCRAGSPQLSVGVCWWLPRAKRKHSGLKPFSSAGWEEEFFIPTTHWF